MFSSAVGAFGKQTTAGAAAPEHGSAGKAASYGSIRSISDILPLSSGPGVQDVVSWELYFWRCEQ